VKAMFTDKKDIERLPAFSMKFNDSSLTDLVLMAQKDDQEAYQEICLRLNDSILSLAKLYEREYHEIEDDWSEYYCAIIKATEIAIKWYKPDRGEFSHFWRKIIKFEKIRLVRTRGALKNYRVQNTYYISSTNDPIAQALIYQYGDENLYADFVKSLYVDELMETVLDFVAEKYSKKDETMIIMWLNYYTLDEISKELNIDRKYLLGRLYTIINAIRKNTDIDKYI